MTWEVPVRRNEKDSHCECGQTLQQGEIVESPSLEIFSINLEMALNNLI